MPNITDSFFTNIWRNGRLERVVLQNSGHMEHILIINTGAYTLDFFAAFEVGLNESLCYFAVCVCFVREHVSGVRSYMSDLHQTYYFVHVTVARCSFGGVAVRYVLPV